MSRRLRLSPTQFVNSAPGYDAANCPVNKRYFDPINFKYKVIEQIYTVYANQFALNTSGQIQTSSYTINFPRTFPEPPEVLIAYRIPNQGGVIRSVGFRQYHQSGWTDGYCYPVITVGTSSMTIGRTQTAMVNLADQRQLQFAFTLPLDTTVILFNY